ncbi:hypothetical protein [Dactylosporangium sp. CA-233914]|uniref:hypothetical protein n=1 Tax=Dactylosporangium sp. CA-233914 TaxID=3239934 RepID=UPI003D901F9F
MNGDHVAPQRSVGPIRESDIASFLIGDQPDTSNMIVVIRPCTGRARSVSAVVEWAMHDANRVIKFKAGRCRDSWSGQDAKPPARPHFRDRRGFSAIGSVLLGSPWASGYRHAGAAPVQPRPLPQS